MIFKLNRKTLADLPDDVSVPSYDQAGLSPGIVHIGVGNFHRAHQAFYLNKLFNEGRDHDWAIVGAGVKSFDTAMRDKLEAQDWLTTVVELGADGFTATVTGAMIDFAQVDPAALIDMLAQPAIRIVSLTITEGGYFVDGQTGGFDRTNAEILRDISSPQDMRTVFGILIAALDRRRAAGVAPFTIMSCDNLPENGRIARQAVLGLADAIPGDIGAWISANVAFPNSMVDCITPATGDRERALVRDTFAIDDSAPVVCEPFRQWVLEDTFTAGRPTLESVGVEFVSDVAPYEIMKLRILNGGHAAIAYPAALLGIDMAHDAVTHPLVSGFLHKVEHDEIIPTVPAIPGVDFEQYYQETFRRFSNAAIGDTVARLCLDGSNRQPKFILPTIQDRIEAGMPVDGLALEVALWCRYCAGRDEAGAKIDVVDERAVQLRGHALQSRTEPAAFLRQREIFGSLTECDVFVRAFSTAVKRLWEVGTARVLEDYLSS